jgi:hypothetical protein
VSLQAQRIDEGSSSIASPPTTLTSQLGGSGTPQLGWEALPPYEEVVDGVQTLTTSFFQLGFIPKALFFEQLRVNRDSIDVFLLFGILSVSARFTPSLVRRYHGGHNATQAFLSRAICLVQERMFNPTLDSIQGFFLMSIAEWGNGDKNRSLVCMGIAVRLAGILRMHREETYRLPDDAPKHDVVHSEAARRTFWMLETFENLHSGSDSPIAFSYGDITVLLPCDERDFIFGTQPSLRAALIGTPPATQDPGLTRLPSRSLFATLLQTHSLWGKVAKVVSADARPSIMGGESRLDFNDYQRLSQALIEFERQIPPQHVWSIWNFRGFKVENLDLAYLSAVMVLRLSNIILRRSYLHDLLSVESRENISEASDSFNAWSIVSDQLFDNMLILHEQINAFFEYRSADQGYPALIVFCVYVCGSLANHLRKQPQLCSKIAPQATDVLKRSINGLSDLQSAWPLAKSWYMALCSASSRSPPHDTRAPARHTEASPSKSGIQALQIVYDNEAIYGMDVQFNDPFLPDSLFEVFETYLWGDINGTAERSTYGELFAEPPFAETG